LIYVKRNPALIPEKILKVAERAQQDLEKLPETERKPFIESKGRIWRSFGRYLAKMSYGKCWYTESNDPQSFFDVDHFRPKKEAKRAEGIEDDDGYPWLAFSWDNFRYSAGRSNRLSKDEITDETCGKGSWFPLLDGSVKANWNNRCEATEAVLLLDPTVRDDLDLITIDAVGKIVPSWVCAGLIKKHRVKRSVEIYGLNLPKLVGARAKVMRDIELAYQTLVEQLVEDNDSPALARHKEQLRQATMSDATYALAARSKLLSLPEGSYFCASPEDHPMVAL
jgi:hypothetical protein